MLKTIQNKSEWDRIIGSMDHYDFYHTYDYHDLLKEDPSEPILIYFCDKDTEIAIPFIKRTLQGGYFDLTSVHGYLGPLVKNLPVGYDAAQFCEQLNELFKDQNIVSVFSKLNPFLDHQADILKHLGEIETVGELLYFDESESDEIQESRYNKNTRRTLKKLKKMAFMKKLETDAELDIFIEMYHANMDRLDARETFYYDKAYFETLLNSKEFDAQIHLVIHKETRDIMAGALYVISGSICQLEVIATDRKYFKYSPGRLSFDWARAFFKKDGIKYLNLGGGQGGREGSLMKFKSSFTQHYIDFCVWKHIVLPEVYTNLLNENQKQSNSLYFPKYRLEV